MKIVSHPLISFSRSPIAKQRKVPHGILGSIPIRQSPTHAKGGLVIEE